MKLVYEATGIEVKVGDTVIPHNWEPTTVQGIEKPKHGGSTGRIYLGPDGVGRYPSVIGAKWIEREDQEEADEPVMALCNAVPLTRVQAAALWVMASKILPTLHEEGFIPLEFVDSQLEKMEKLSAIMEAAIEGEFSAVNASKGLMEGLNLLWTNLLEPKLSETH